MTRKSKYPMDDAFWDLVEDIYWRDFKKKHPTVKVIEIDLEE